MLRTHLTAVLVCLAVAATIVLIACGGDGSTPQTGFVNTMVSDPPTCSTPNGPYLHVYVTVTDVEIHSSSTGEWVDLTPELKPKQIDLLGKADTQCFLAMLGSKTELQAGKYEQIRIHLADTSAKNVTLQASNQCGSSGNSPLNCVVLAPGGGANTFPLELSSESKTGLKIPSGQLAGGSFTVEAGQTKDLTIDFDTCASIVLEGNGTYHLKPVLHAGEVALESAVNGKVVDAGNNNQPLTGALVVVALEKRDPTGVDRVVISTTADQNGDFALCPVPTDTYDLIATAVKNGTAYAATVLTGVHAGNVVGNVPLFPTSNNGNNGTASFQGTVTTTGVSGGISEDVRLSALLPVSFNGDNFSVTVPDAAQLSATLTFPTEDTGSCALNQFCQDFTIAVPAVSSAVGAFGSAITYTQSVGATYTIDAQTLPLDTPVCSPGPDVKSSGLPVSPGDTSSGILLSFTDCVAPPATP
jgi:hypothetical protein